MELRQLRYFTAVVEAGSFTAAAAVLHVSQPPLSVAVAKLETELGVALLVRTPRGVEPTSAGRYLLGRSSRVLGDIDDISSALARFGSGLVGSITVAAVPQLMWHRVPRLVRALYTSAPDIEVKLVDPPPWAAIDMLAHRRVDLAAIVVADPVQFRARYGESMKIIDWGPIPLVAALPPEIVDAPDPYPVGLFDGEVVLLPQRTAAVPSLAEAVEKIFHAAGVTPSSVRTVDTIQAGLPLIEAGTTRAILPDADGESLARFAVITRRLDPQPTPLRALILSRAGDSTDPTVDRLLEHIHSDGVVRRSSATIDPCPSQR